MRPIVSNLLHGCVSYPLGADDFETNEGQEWQNRCSGSQGVGRPKLLLSTCEWCQALSDALGVQNQLIHKLSDLPRTKLLAKGQRMSRSLSLDPDWFWETVLPLKTDQPLGSESLSVKIPPVLCRVEENQMTRGHSRPVPPPGGSRGLPVCSSRGGWRQSWEDSVC